ncbi:hypothetical protein JIG36_35885 [Actinoplanes sp. LDG1-06]|uniref:Uncharacterized protein n=1 Tax=Paractinoplanes ovalisporus TaxID=2810368 RepID=A0ABS2AM80_9ACTN|nr:hypothetical protein [Actinoplanes ovalisporus]MBM2620896.1 hypothetical protein [Actinoplanes ovalisporus]
MKVPHVSTETGQSVTLQFGPEQVEVHETSPARPRAVRACVGGLLLGTGLAAVAVNAGDRGFAGLDLALWVLVALALAATAGGGVWWFLLARRDRRRTPYVISPATVVNARSSAEAAQVTVSLQLEDGGERSFAAVGHAGAQLSAGFSRLLSA